MVGPIVHVEWKSLNFARTAAFYSRVFDWRTEQNGSGSYMKLDGADGPSGGWVRADLVQAPGPVAFLAVDDVGAKLDEIEKAGGRVLVRSLPFAGGGEVGLFADPDGNVLGLWRRKSPTPSDSAAAAKPAAAEKPREKPSKPARAGDKPAKAKPVKKK